MVYLLKDTHLTRSVSDVATGPGTKLILSSGLRYKIKPTLHPISIVDMGLFCFYFEES